MKNLNSFKSLLFLVISVISLSMLISCQKCKTCKYKAVSGNQPNPETQYCDDELTQAEKDATLTCS